MAAPGAGAHCRRSARVPSRRTAISSRADELFCGGRGCPLSDDLRAAVAPRGTAECLVTLRPAGFRYHLAHERRIADVVIDRHEGRPTDGGSRAPAPSGTGPRTGAGAGAPVPSAAGPHAVVASRTTTAAQPNNGVADDGTTVRTADAVRARAFDQYMSLNVAGGAVNDPAKSARMT